MTCTALSPCTDSSLQNFNVIDSAFGGELFRFHRENRQLFLGKQYYKFQAEEQQRENAMLFSEVELLERLLSERKSRNEEEQKRLIARYESEFVKMRAECETRRAEMKTLEDQLNNMVENEDQRMKKIADQRSLLESNQSLLVTTQKEKEDLNLKLVQCENELNSTKQLNNQEDCTSCKSLENKVHKLNSKLKRALSRFCKERFGYKKHIAELETLLAGKDETLQEKQTGMESYKVILMERSAALLDQKKKTKFLYERVKKVDEIGEANKLLREKQQKAEKENEQLNKKIKMLKKQRDRYARKLKDMKNQESSEEEIPSGEFKDKIEKLQKERAKLQENFEKEINVAKIESTEMKKMVEELQKKFKDRESKLQYVKGELENTTSELKDEKKKAKGLKERYETLSKQFVEEKSKKEKLEKDVVEITSQLTDKKTEVKKLKTNEQQMTEKPFAVDPNEDESRKDRSEQNETVDSEEGQRYISDFESDNEEEACEEYISEHSVSVKSDKNIPSENSAAAGEMKVPVNINDYDNDFKQESFCEESVASYISDSESEKSGLFFGSKKIEHDIIEEFASGQDACDDESENPLKVSFGSKQEKKVDAIEIGNDTKPSNVEVYQVLVHDAKFNHFPKKTQFTKTEVKKKQADDLFLKDSKNAKTKDTKSGVMVTKDAKRTDAKTTDTKTKEQKGLMETLFGAKPDEEIAAASTTSLCSAPPLSTKDSLQRAPSSIEGSPSLMSKSFFSATSMSSLVHAPSLAHKSSGDEVIEEKKKSKKKNASDLFGPTIGKESGSANKGKEKVTAADIFSSSCSADCFDDDELESDIGAVLGCL